ncbi:MAG: carboxypeptidase regulatory-like domain-containing protein [Flavobacteriales bacterium]
MKKLTTAILFLFTLMSTQAQEVTQTIRGTILEKNTGTPIPGAVVKLTTVTPGRGITANDDGTFRFENVAVGRHSLIITATGFNPVALNNLSVSSARELVLNVDMEEEITEMSEVVVTAETDKEKPNNEMATVSARQFSFEESSRYAGNFNDVARMAQSFAGVGGADDSRNDIIVRGNSPIGVLFRLDGLDIPNPNHFAVAGTTGGPVSMLNNNLMANSDFMSSAFPAEYGNAMSAVFDLKFRKGNNEKHEFVGQFGFNGVELMAEGPLSKKHRASYLLSYRYSTLEIFKALGIDFGTTSIPKYQDVSVKLNFPNKKGTTSVFGVGGLSNVELLNRDIDTSNNLFAEEGEDIYFWSKVGLAGISNTWLINESSYLRTTVGVTVQNTRIINDSLSTSDLSAVPFYRQNSTQGKYSLVLLYNKKFSAKHLVRSGLYADNLFFMLSDSIYRNSLNQFVVTSDFNGIGWLLQPYMQWQYRPTNQITFNTGVHVVYSSLNEDVSIEPRISAKFSVGKRQAINVGYGLHSQVAPYEIYFEQQVMADGSYVRANKNLGFTKAHHAVLGHDFVLGNQTRIKTEVYYQYLYNVPVDVNINSYSLLNQGANFGIGFPDSLQNKGTGTNMGAEITWEKFFSKGYYYLVTVSVFDSKYKGSDGKEHNTAFNGQYMLNVLGGKEFYFGKKDENGKRSQKNALTVDFRFTINGGQRYTPVDVTLSQLYNTEITDDSKAFDLQLPAYFRSDIKIGFKHNGKRTSQTFYIDLRNITNQQNVFIRKYDVATNTYRSSYQTGFLPVAQYRIEF